MAPVVSLLSVGAEAAATPVDAEGGELVASGALDDDVLS